LAEGVPDSIARNAAAWDGWAAEYAEPGRRNWQSNEPSFGIWDFPEAEIGFLGDVDGKDVVELGCGTAYISSWVARRGGRPVGVDPSAGQLETARGLQAEFGLDFPLVQAGAENVPLPDAAFDLALSEYGASLWADPERWLSEAARLLRPGGRLVFLRSAPLLILCEPLDGSVPARGELQRPHFGGLGRIEWPDDDSVEYIPSHGDLIRVLVASGFVIEELLELQAPEGGDSGRWDFVTLEWARRWPSEEVWKARKTA
jgi:SAM-dependent methyltransferase